MRYIELVVEYRAFPDTSDPDPAMQWAAAFVVQPRASEALAASEPPQHDEWSEANISPRNQPDSREGRSWRPPCERCSNAIEDAVQSRWGPLAPPAQPASPSVLNRFALAAEFLVAGLPGTRPPGEKPEPDPRPGTRRAESQILIGLPELALEDDEVVARYPVQTRIRSTGVPPYRASPRSR